MSSSCVEVRPGNFLLVVSRTTEGIHIGYSLQLGFGAAVMRVEWKERALPFYVFVYIFLFFSLQCTMSLTERTKCRQGSFYAYSRINTYRNPSLPSASFPYLHIAVHSHTHAVVEEVGLDGERWEGKADDTWEWVWKVKDLSSAMQHLPPFPFSTPDMQRL